MLFITILGTYSRILCSKVAVTLSIFVVGSKIKALISPPNSGSNNFSPLLVKTKLIKLDLTCSLVVIVWLNTPFPLNKTLIPIAFLGAKVCGFSLNIGLFIAIKFYRFLLIYPL